MDTSQPPQGWKPKPGEPAGGRGRCSDLHRPQGGSYLDSAGSAPGAAPGRAAAAQGQSGPGQAPHWGCREAGRTKGVVSLQNSGSLATPHSGCSMDFCPPVTSSLGLVPPVLDSLSPCLCHGPPSVSLHITLTCSWSELPSPPIRSRHLTVAGRP